MDFDFTDEQKEFRGKVEAFCKENVTQDLLNKVWEKGEQHDPEFYKKMAKAGFIAACWPREYGGLGKGAVERNILTEVMGYYEAPIGGYGTTVGMVGQSILLNGTEAQKKEFLPRIARGEILCALGMTEPEAGSDAAAVRTRAAPDGDHWVINGNKFFITNANLADYILTVTRTNTEAPKHKGISLFLVDAGLPGVTVNPLWTMSHWRVNEVVYENVRVPGHMILGEKDRGWEHLVKTFEVERTGLGGTRNLRRLLERLVEYAVATGKITSERVRGLLAELATCLEIARLLFYQAAWRFDQGLPIDVHAPFSKLFSSELYQFASDAGLEILGPEGQIRRDSPHAKLQGQFELLARHSIASTIGGGSSEVQLNIIAVRGLGLPR